MRITLLLSLLILTPVTVLSDPLCVPDTTAVALGRSMAPYLWDGEALTIECRTPQRGEIAVFVQQRHSRPLIKWVVAAPGDQVGLVDGAMIVNGVVATNAEGTPYHFSGGREETLRGLEGPIPDDQYLVLGNDPHGTDDSSRYGFVNTSQVIGAAHKSKGLIGYVDTAALHVDRRTALYHIGRVATHRQIRQIVTTGVVTGTLTVDLTTAVLRDISR